jgi:predicted O-linked N-acetylglucosamine transferase (SPINDLY family)
VIPAEDETFYLEKAVRLPDTYQPNDGDLKVDERPSREAVGLPPNGLVFCCFNNTFKITPEVFNIWMRLLGQIDDSVLWLFESNATAKANLQKEATARGISPERLVFAPLADYTTYLARTQLADLFLDNNYWNGHSTASDALRCGVPLITCQGTSFASRVASSLLRAIEMPELITHSLEEYEALALKLARDPALLAATKEKLAKNRLTTPLFDTERFTRHLEAAYQTMYERAQRGEPPASFTVEALPPKI